MGLYRPSPPCSPAGVTTMQARTRSIAAVLLALTATVVPATGQASEHGIDRCEQADELFAGPSGPLRVERGVVYSGLSDWYEHDAQAPGPTTYELVPAIGDADLLVYDADCPGEPACSSRADGREAEVCRVPGEAHVVEVRGIESPQPGLGVHYLVRVPR